MGIQRPQGTYTGLLGYSRKFENLGEGLPFRLVETYDYEIYDNSLAGRADLRAYFKSQFSDRLGLYSGDVNIKSLTFPNSQDTKEDGVRFQKYSLAIETRSAGQYQQGYSNTRLDGISGAISNSGAYDYLKELSEDFSFNNGESAEKSYKHSLSFSLRTGELYTDFYELKPLAVFISNSLFGGAEAAALSQIGFVNYSDYLDESESQVYYSESYDTAKMSFSFEKTRRILDSGNSAYSQNLQHSIQYGEDGFIKIDESIRILGRKTFEQARNGFDVLLAGSNARCLAIATGYYPVVFESSSSQITLPSGLTRTSLNKSYNEPTLMVEGTVSYTNNPAYSSGFVRNSSFNVNKSSNGTLEINHQIDYSLNYPVNQNTDDYIVSGSKTMPEMLKYEADQSSSYCLSVYDGLTSLTGISSPRKIKRLKSQISSPERGKTYRAEFNYSDSPVFNTVYSNPYTSTEITGFRQLESSINVTSPKDSIQEYKIINRPEKQSVLHYGYQQDFGRATVDFKGVIERRGNSFETHYIPTGEAFNLIQASQPMFLNKCFGGASLFSYYLSDVKYGLNSQNDFDLSVEYTYSKKKI